jgi:hypothetical protein
MSTVKYYETPLHAATQERSNVKIINPYKILKYE